MLRVCGILAVTIGVCGCTSVVNWPGNGAIQELDDQLDLKLGIAQRAERSGALTEARASYLEIAKSHPDYSPALHRLGVVSIKLEELDEAIRYLERAEVSNPGSSVLLGDLGYAHFLRGDLEAAHDRLNQALSIDPTDKRLINNQGVVLGYMGDIDKCMDMFRRANSEAEAMANVGFVLSQTGDFENSKKYFHRALELDPDLRTAARGLLDFYHVDKLRSRQPTSANDRPVSTASDIVMSVAESANVGPLASLPQLEPTTASGLPVQMDETTTSAITLPPPPTHVPNLRR